MESGEAVPSSNETEKHSTRLALDPSQLVTGRSMASSVRFLVRDHLVHVQCGSTSDAFRRYLLEPLAVLQQFRLLVSLKQFQCLLAWSHSSYCCLQPRVVR